jgi:hypothetical protein
MLRCSASVKHPVADGIAVNCRKYNFLESDAFKVVFGVFSVYKIAPAFDVTNTVKSSKKYDSVDRNTFTRRLPRSTQY